jgi:hypothetical protein
MATRRTTGPKLEYDQIIVKRSGRTWGLVATVGQAIVWGLLAMFYASDIYWYGVGLVLFPLGLAVVNVVAAVILGKDPNERY